MLGFLTRSSASTFASDAPPVAQLMQMLDHLSEIVLLCDTSRENRIFYMNRSAREAITQRFRTQLNEGMSGLDAADVMGSPVHPFHPHPDRLRQALTHPDILPFEDELPLGDNTFRISVHAIWDEVDPGKVACFMVCWTDITAHRQQRQIEAELERKRRLEDRIQQIAAAVEQMSATVAEVAGNTHEAAQNSDQVAHTAQEGQEIVKQAGSGMLQVAEMVRNASEAVRRLGNQSAQINAIANVIDGIADQTNMLALNAAIEAARAGDQGRGFAVVADEVRKLAERTTEATGEIARVIRMVQQETQAVILTMEEGQQQVARGEELSRKAEAALGRIVLDIENVNSMIAHIASATHEQAATSQEIARNLDEAAKL